MKSHISFAEFSRSYIAGLERLQRKSPLTIEKERYSLERWEQTIGKMALHNITRDDITRHLESRKAEGCCNRTLNLDVLTLGNVLHAAKDAALIKEVITTGMKPLAHTPPRRALITEEDTNRLCAAAATRCNGQQFSDYIHFLMFTGARKESAINVRWSDVDFANKRLTLHKTKYDKMTVVTFNERLEKLLTEMHFRRTALPSEWLFPDVARPEEKANFRRTLDQARLTANLPDWNYHDCRHFFISHAIMSGVDTLTVAKWVGHSDGGVLIGKVYGHLSDSHQQTQAAKLKFGPQSSACAVGADVLKMTIGDLMKAVPGAFEQFLKQ